MMKQTPLIPILIFILGALLFIDELYFWIPGTELLHWLPDLSRYHIDPFHHWFLGLAMMIVAIFWLFGVRRDARD